MRKNTVWIRTKEVTRAVSYQVYTELNRAPDLYHVLGASQLNISPHQQFKDTTIFHLRKIYEHVYCHTIVINSVDKSAIKPCILLEMSLKQPKLTDNQQIQTHTNL